ncbi:MAG: type 1 glutamine amidotransferase [Parvibaculum sp.]|uniref:type 1 glutamine amidotransferase n=1 Tax=Parvibaculum sp. TaxID=2024848 RepID=UPI003C784EAF
MRILYLINEANSGPGVLLEEATRLGASADLIFAPETRDFATGAVRDVPATSEGYDGLVALGGIMGVYDEADHPFIDKTRALMRRFHEERKPVMGVCLGAQMLASAFGGRVYKMGYDEWGFLPQTWTAEATEDPLLGDAEQGLAIMQWHGDTFELPEGAVRLATRETCANQAFRLGERTYGFQFHLEVTRETTDFWTQLRAENSALPLDEIKAGLNAEALPAQQAFARRVMGRWMALAE